jgi:hypothetical protein
VNGHDATCLYRPVQPSAGAGHHAEVVAELTAVVAAEPFRERLQELRMLALYRSGRQADALASYRELQAILHREAGLDPAPALQQLHHQILQADPELLTPPDVAGLPRPSCRPVPVSPLRPGRDAVTSPWRQRVG